MSNYVVLRRNFFEIDGKLLEPYIDYYFEIKKYKGIPKIIEADKCDELLWADVNDLPEPFINYEGKFLEDKTITISGKFIEENYAPTDDTGTIKEVALCNSSTKGNDTFFMYSEVPTINKTGDISLEYTVVISID